MLRWKLTLTFYNDMDCIATVQYTPCSFVVFIWCLPFHRPIIFTDHSTITQWVLCFTGSLPIVLIWLWFRPIMFLCVLFLENTYDDEWWCMWENWTKRDANYYRQLLTSFAAAATAATAADFGVDEAKHVGHQFSDVGQAQQHYRYADQSVRYAHQSTPERLGRDISITSTTQQPASDVVYYSVSQKNPPLGFSENFSQMVGNF